MVLFFKKHAAVICLESTSEASVLPSQDSVLLLTHQNSAAVEPFSSGSDLFTSFQKKCPLELVTRPFLPPSRRCYLGGPISDPAPLCPNLLHNWKNWQPADSLGGVIVP